MTNRWRRLALKNQFYFRCRRLCSFALSLCSLCSLSLSLSSLSFSLTHSGFELLSGQFCRPSNRASRKDLSRRSATTSKEEEDGEVGRKQRRKEQKKDKPRSVARRRHEQQQQKQQHWWKQHHREERPQRTLFAAKWRGPAQPVPDRWRPKWRGSFPPFFVVVVFFGFSTFSARDRGSHLLKDQSSSPQASVSPTPTSMQPKPFRSATQLYK